MTTIEMMVGLPGSGKSTYCQTRDGIWISSDNVREELYGDCAVQENPGKVFARMWKKLCEAVESGSGVVFYDATNIAVKRRIAFCEDLKKKYGDTVKLVARVFYTPIEDCIARVESREKNPLRAEVVERFLRQWQTPYYWEGWNKIIIEGENADNQRYIDGIFALWDEAKLFDQKNPHHSHSLAEHMSVAGEIVDKYIFDNGFETVIKHSAYVSLATHWHDIGKLRTQTFREDGVAHYYGHESYGGYLLLPSGLYVSALVCHHMDLYNPPKYMKKMDADFMRALEIIHMADKGAH